MSRTKIRFEATVLVGPWNGRAPASSKVPGFSGSRGWRRSRSTGTVRPRADIPVRATELYSRSGGRVDTIAEAGPHLPRFDHGQHSDRPRQRVEFLSGIMDSTTNDGSLAQEVHFEMVGQQLGRDLKIAIGFALRRGAVFELGTNPLSIFRNTVLASIREIETDPRGMLFQRLLRDGPYEHPGAIPRELRDARLSDEETAKATTFIYSFMVNSFKGAMTELLASAVCQRLVDDLRIKSTMPAGTRIYVGDAVLGYRKTGTGRVKCADLHLLNQRPHSGDDSELTVVGVVEVKSGQASREAMGRQLDRHLIRASQGLHVAGTDHRGAAVRIGFGPRRRVLRITVQPSDWRLPRSFRFEDSDHGRILHVTPPRRPRGAAAVDESGHDSWHIKLSWSKEALADAAYAMTFWYMEKVGEVIYSSTGVPAEWGEMSPAEAGRNAIKMMLYYAMLRFRSGSRDEQRAVALYNTYGFGYALGMSFRGPDGKRRMLWPADLDAIAANSATSEGCTLRD